jgi:hypothetical protein
LYGNAEQSGLPRYFNEMLFPCAASLHKNVQLTLPQRHKFFSFVSKVNLLKSRLIRLFANAFAEAFSYLAGYLLSQGAFGRFQA